MKMYLPEIYPDELVYSWLSRYFVCSGCTNNRMLLSQLLYSKSNNPSIEFIGHLNEAAEQQITQVYSMDNLILNHTMFPQYARFMPADKRDVALAELKRYCDPHKVFTILPRNDRELWLKYCPLCVAEDRKKYGETYWHRVHQVRNMLICPTHRCKLVNSEVDIRSEKIFAFNPAEMAISNVDPVLVDNMEQIKFAKYVSDLFNMNITNSNESNIKAAIYNAITKTKYMKGKHRKMAQFSEDLQSYFMEIGMNTIVSIYQIQKVILKESNEFTAICQIAYFLNINPTELLESEVAEEIVMQERKSHYIKNHAIAGWEKFDIENVVRFEEFCKGVYDGSGNDSGRPERVSEKMIYKFLGITSYGFKNMPRCMAVYERYAESYEESWARKIVWAYNKLKKENTTIYWSYLRKLSGVKKESYQKTIPFLERYTDRETYTDILKIG